MSVCVKARRADGFTLIELMVTIVVATILIAIAVPTYQAQIRKSRRVEAKDAVMDLASREERYFSSNNSYTKSAKQLGYGPDDADISGLSIGSGYYTVSVDAQQADPTTTPPKLASFTITANAVGSQVKDATCLTFSVDYTGTQTSTPSATQCWN